MILDPSLVEQLIAKWRSDAKADARGGVAEALRSHREFFGRVNAAFIYAECADELEAALQGSPEQQKDDTRVDKPTHGLERTSPKGGPFVGRCIYCGQTGLPMRAATLPCSKAPNKDQRIIDAIEGRTESGSTPTLPEED